MSCSSGPNSITTAKSSAVLQRSSRSSPWRRLFWRQLPLTFCANRLERRSVEELTFWLKLDGLRIMAGQNWLVLHNTPAVSAHQKRAARVFRFEYSEHFLAVQRIRSSDASV